MTATANQREQRERTVHDHIAAENAGDIDATVATFYRPRYNVLPMGAICDGEAAVRQLVAGLVGAFPDFQFQLVKLHHADEAVVVEGLITGTHKADWAGLTARGNRMELPAVCIFDFDAERLINESVYFDFATLQRQLTS
jgi:steroid delta-isomerase-like uncharacterized protein